MERKPCIVCNKPVGEDYFHYANPAGFTTVNICYKTVMGDGISEEDLICEECHEDPS